MEHSLASTQLMTLSVAIAAGGFLMVIARATNIPGIVLLLAGGVALGPQGWGIVQPDSLGDILQIIVAMAVGLILFEGGLTLNLHGYRSVGGTIRKLLSVGVLITWVCTAFLIWIFYRFPIEICFLAGSLLIVTGPTVIQPILKRIRLKWNLHHILHWESVLIDPIGVFIAVLAFEWAIVGAGEAALGNLGLRFLAGAGIGAVGGEITYRLLRFIKEDVLNVFILASAIFVFGITEAVIEEAGLLSVIVAGLVVGARRPPHLRAIVEFKATIIDLLIGMLFILLVSRLEIQQFMDFGLKGVLLVATFLLLVRPLTIFGSTRGGGFMKRELVFLSWIAPRGVVAAFMASFFALSLGDDSEYGIFIETFTFSIIVATVILQGFSAGPLARLLRLQQKHPEGWLIVGAHPLGRQIATFLKDTAKVNVLLVDTNRMEVDEALADGLPAVAADAREVEAIAERPQMQGIGHLLAITDNEDLNELLCTRWAESFGKQYVYRWASNKTHINKPGGVSGRMIWPWLQRPSVLSSELITGSAAMITVENAAVTTRGSITPMILLSEGELTLDPDPKKKVRQGKDPARMLCVQREIDPLLEVLNPQLMLHVNATSRDELLSQLVEHASRQFEGIDSNAIYRAVQERELQAPSDLGNEVAIPHARIPGLPHSICVVAQTSTPIPWRDRHPVRLAFLLLSPEDEPENHLAMIGEIARLVADRQIRNELMSASDFAKILNIIRDRRRHQLLGPEA